MTIKAKNIKDSFAQLSKIEQLELMHHFLQVISGDDDDFILSEDWKSELDKRDQSYKTGASKTYSVDEALKQFDQ